MEKEYSICTEIPKVIHYCWFGHNPLPDLAVRCISSWKKYCPDYEIKQWNEENFDVEICLYTKQAYQEKKWAFVSDYARFWILYHYGGVYFDTDVELIKPIDKIVQRGPFMGTEPGAGTSVKRKTNVNCAPGLGLGAVPGLGLYQEILEFYQKRNFLNEDGTRDQTTVVKYATGLLRKHGWKDDGGISCVEGIYVYPPDYFCPKSYFTGLTTITENTISIHHYEASWFSPLEKKIFLIERKFNDRFGLKIGTRMGRICSLPYRVINKIQKSGVGGTICFILKGRKRKEKNRLL